MAGLGPSHQSGSGLDVHEAAICVLALGSAAACKPKTNVLAVKRLDIGLDSIEAKDRRYGPRPNLCAVNRLAGKGTERDHPAIAISIT